MLPLVQLAQVPPIWVDLGLLNEILFQFENAASGWTTNLLPYALATFGLLAVLELAWTGVRATIDPKGSLDGTLELILRKTIYLGFVLYLIEVSPALLPMVVGSFQQAGAVASGIDRLHPSSFLATGVSIAATYLSQLNAAGLLVDPLGYLMAVPGAFMIVLLFAAMAGIVLLALIESLFAISAVPFLLAMAGSRWTARIAEGSLAYVIRIGVKLFFVYLVGGVANGLTTEWANLINSSTLVGPVSYLAFVGTTFALTLIVFAVPRYAANMIQPTLTFGLTPAIGDN